MRFRARVLLTIVITGLVAGGCGKDGSEDISGQPGELPDEIVTEFVTEESDSGRVRWKLSAPHASRFTRLKVLEMTKPRVEFYDEFGNLQSTLTSDAGEYFDKSHDMLAFGNVIVVTVEGDILETDSLRYLNEEDRIVNDCYNKLTRGNDVITGYGLECDHNLSSVEIKRDVEARFINDEPGIMDDGRNPDEEE